MFSILRSVKLADRCFLPEALYWFALKRFPLKEYDRDDMDENADLRFSVRGELNLSHLFELERPVSLAECEMADLPPNPRYRAFLEEGYREQEYLEGLDEQISHTSADSEEMTRLLAEKQSAVDWDKLFDDYLGYFKSKLFVDLMEGAIEASGVRVKGSTFEDLQRAVDTDDIARSIESHSTIRKTEWVSSKIDWDKSILYGAESSYCWVNFNVGRLLSAYPPSPDLPIIHAKKLGDSYILEQEIDGDAPEAARRGRPPLRWEPFHVEVASLLLKNALPAKKEAAIAHFENWFRETLGQPAGRSTISQKLTPYYEKFFGRSTEKQGKDFLSK